MDSLARKHNRLQVREALKTLPEEINAVYDEAMHRILDPGREDSQLARKVLSWISFARRPLKLIELQSALTIQPGSPRVDESAFIEEDILVSVCGGLVTVDHKSCIIGLVHYTTQEYFEKTRNTWFPDADSELATVCLACVLHQMPPDGFRFGKSWDLFLKDTLLQYACINWGHHVRTGRTPSVVNAALMFLEQESKFLDVMQLASVHDSRIQHLLQSLTRRRRSQSLIILDILVGMPKGAALWAAIHFELDEIIRLLLENGADVDARFGYTHEYYASHPEAGITGLQYAAFVGKQAIAQLLLEKGANVNAEASKIVFTIAGFHLIGGSTALSYASLYGNIEVAQLLLENGANITLGDAYGSALHASAFSHHQKIVQMLLDHGADINARTAKQGITPLQKATMRTSLEKSREHVEFVGFLICRGADVNLTDKSGSTPIKVAAQNRNLPVLQMLLALQTDKDLKSQEMCVAFHALIESFCAESWKEPDEARATLKGLRFLLKMDIDIDNMVDGMTPLHRAMKTVETDCLWPIEHMEVARYLLENGADVDRVTEEGKTALCLAREHDDLPMVRLLEFAMDEKSPQKTHRETGLVVQ